MMQLNLLPPPGARQSDPRRSRRALLGLIAGAGLVGAGHFALESQCDALRRGLARQDREFERATQEWSVRSRALHSVHQNWLQQRQRDRVEYGMRATVCRLQELSRILPEGVVLADLESVDGRWRFSGTSDDVRHAVQLTGRLANSKSLGQLRLTELKSSTSPNGSQTSGLHFVVEEANG